MNHLIVDGFGLAFRSHYAFSELRTATGNLSGCVYGFLVSLSPWKKRFMDCHITVAWDSGHARRDAAFSGYKADRPKLTMGDQIHDLKASLACMNITQAESPGEEADDVIAALVKQYSEEGRVFIFSSDKDITQLVQNGKVIMIRPSSGKNQERFFDEEEVKREFEVTPKNMACYQAFRGDTVDSIPGLPRVRSTIIAALVEKYITPDDIYRHLAEEKLTDFERKAFTDFEQQAKVNFQLTQLVNDIPLQITKGSIDPQKFSSYLNKYEIRKIASEPYTKLFENESSFNNRASPVLEVASLFDEE